MFESVLGCTIGLMVPLGCSSLCCRFPLCKTEIPSFPVRHKDEKAQKRAWYYHSWRFDIKNYRGTPAYVTEGCFPGVFQWDLFLERFPRAGHPPAWSPLVASPIAGFRLLHLRAGGNNWDLPIGKSRQTNQTHHVLPLGAALAVSPHHPAAGAGVGGKEMWVGALGVVSRASRTSEAEPPLVVSHFGSCSCFVFPLLWPTCPSVQSPALPSGRPPELPFGPLSQESPSTLRDVTTLRLYPVWGHCTLPLFTSSHQEAINSLRSFAWRKKLAFLFPSKQCHSASGTWWHLCPHQPFSAQFRGLCPTLSTSTSVSNRDCYTEGAPTFLLPDDLL